MTTTPTPCSVPPCDAETGEPCDRHEREAAHAEDDHELCGPECEPTAPATAGLRQRIETVLREAELDGGPDCPHESDEACSAAHPIQAGYTQHGVVREVYGPPEALADALLPLFAAERADAVRGAADAYDAHRCNQSGPPGFRLPCEHTLNTADWLRARADAIHPQDGGQT